MTMMDEYGCFDDEEEEEDNDDSLSEEENNSNNNIALTNASANSQPANPTTNNLPSNTAAPLTTTTAAKPTLKHMQRVRESYDDLADHLSEQTSNATSSSLFASANSAEFGKRINLSVRVQNEIVKSEKKGEKRISHQGKDDRATSEQVLDPRTRLILFKLLNNGFLSEIDGKCF